MRLSSNVSNPFLIFGVGTDYAPVEMWPLMRLLFNSNTTCEYGTLKE